MLTNRYAFTASATLMPMRTGVSTSEKVARSSMFRAPRRRARPVCAAQPLTTPDEKVALTAFRELANATSRGRYATDEQRGEAEALVSQLEAVPQTPPLSTERIRLLDGAWELLYLLSERTTGLQSSSIQQADSSRREVLQSIDVDTGRVMNEARFTSFGIPLSVRISAAFTALDDFTVAVKFRQLFFAVAGLTVFWFPILLFRPKGTLKTTYLSPELRIGRGDKGSIFVLAKKSNRS